MIQKDKVFFDLYITVRVYQEHIFMYSNSLGEKYVVRQSVFKSFHSSMKMELSAEKLFA